LGVVALLGALCNLTTHWNDNLHNQFADQYQPKWSARFDVPGRAAHVTGLPNASHSCN
jgi:hypothetical protein